MCLRIVRVSQARRIEAPVGARDGFLVREIRGDGQEEGPRMGPPSGGTAVQVEEEWSQK